MKAHKNHGGNMASTEERLAVLETTIIHIDSTLTEIKQGLNKLDNRIDRLDSKIDSNFKWLLGMMIGGFASVLGIVAHALHWL